MINLTDALQQFHTVFSTSGELSIWRAPGRVNLIGEHTDYNLGLVLPMAIDLACFVLASPSGDGWLRAYSHEFEEFAEWRVSDIPSMKPEGGWSDRVVGVAWALLRAGYSLAGTDLLIVSDVPVGAGLSSSAALGVSLAMALTGMPAAASPPVARAAEAEFAGVPCGIMDQFVSANGQAGAAILLDCRSLEWLPVPLPSGVSVLVANSMVKRELANAAYRERVAECVAAAAALCVPSLRDARLDQIEGLDPVLRKRARHVITENERVRHFAKACMAGDTGEMGCLFIESHTSLRDDYEVSCPELDFLVETALTVPGVLGARMMGGGFGGSTVILTRAGAIDSLRDTVRARYRDSFGFHPGIFICSPSAGASRVSVHGAHQ